MLTFVEKMNIKHFYPIDARKIETISTETACLVVKKLEEMEINMTELNNCYLRAGHDIFRSHRMGVII